MPATLATRTRLDDLVGDPLDYKACERSIGHLIARESQRVDALPATPPVAVQSRSHVIELGLLKLSGVGYPSRIKQETYPPCMGIVLDQACMGSDVSYWPNADTVLDAPMVFGMWIPSPSRKTSACS